MFRRELAAADSLPDVRQQLHEVFRGDFAAVLPEERGKLAVRVQAALRVFEHLPAAEHKLLQHSSLTPVTQTFPPYFAAQANGILYLPRRWHVCLAALRTFCADCRKPQNLLKSKIFLSVNATNRKFPKTLFMSEVLMYGSAQWVMPFWRTFSTRATRKISAWGFVTEKIPCRERADLKR